MAKYITSQSHINNTTIFHVLLMNRSGFFCLQENGEFSQKEGFFNERAFLSKEEAQKEIKHLIRKDKLKKIS
jgi:hypothetical protein